MIHRLSFCWGKQGELAVQQLCVKSEKFESLMPRERYFCLGCWQCFSSSKSQYFAQVASIFSSLKLTFRVRTRVRRGRWNAGWYSFVKASPSLWKHFSIARKLKSQSRVPPNIPTLERHWSKLVSLLFLYTLPSFLEPRANREKREFSSDRSSSLGCFYLAARARRGPVFTRAVAAVVKLERGGGGRLQRQRIHRFPPTRAL